MYACSESVLESRATPAKSAQGKLTVICAFAWPFSGRDFSAIRTNHLPFALSGGWTGDSGAGIPSSSSSGSKSAFDFPAGRRRTGLADPLFNVNGDFVSMAHVLTAQSHFICNHNHVNIHSSRHSELYMRAASVDAL